jgi:hypothetical protein
VSEVSAQPGLQRTRDALLDVMDLPATERGWLVDRLIAIEVAAHIHDGRHRKCLVRTVQKALLEENRERIAEFKQRIKEEPDVSTA